MKVKGKLKGREIILEKELGISGEVEVEINFPRGGVESFEIEEETDSFIQYAKERANPSISLAQVRRELSSIKGNLSESISMQREERG